MFRSDNDMSMSMNEPRIPRPFLHNHQQGLHMLPPQVSEPSLFSEDISFPFKEVFQPRSTIAQTSPVKSPGFIPQLTPLSVLKKTSSWPQKTSPCGCKTSPFNNSTITSPSVDPEIKELIQDQNRQLNLLQTQVKQLLHYQERLQDKLGEKERANGATQTSSYFDDESPNYNPSPVRVFPRSNNGSPSMRQPQDRTEITLTFRDLQLETIVEQPPSPQPSFVVNMQDYQESVSEEFDDSIDSCVNVMEHVQKLLAQANTKEVQRPLIEKPQERLHVLNEVPERLLFNGSAPPDNPVRKVTMQRVQELGISFINPFPANAPRNPIYYPRSNSRNNHMWDVRKETDQSVEMQRLAEKYLGQSKQQESKKIDFTYKNSRSVEMSMSSQQYLERYGLQEDTEYSSR